MNATEDALLAPGIPTGRFQLLRVLGIGGMGVVYEAYDTRREVRVALKTLNRFSPEGLAAVKREFRIAAERRHPNLVRLYDLVASPGSCFFTLERVEGEDIARYVRGAAASAETPTAIASGPSVASGGPAPSRAWTLRPGAPCDQARLLDTLPQLCAALDCLHQAGVVHRDLKPSNVLVTQEGAVKLLDFGIAQSTALGPSGAFHAGTPHYMSPEQARGERAGPPSDMYSFGVLFFALLTGSLPFHAADTRLLLQQHAEAPPPWPSRLAEEVAPDLEALCLDLLHKDPAQRPSARDALERLVAMGAPKQYLPAPRARRFVGRAHELRQIAATAERARRETRALFLGGESGAGKSALCQEALRGLLAGGWRVLMGRCYERESLPYNALDPLVDALAAALSYRSLPEPPPGAALLASMFPVLGEVVRAPRPDADLSGAQERALATEGLRWLLREYTGGKPLVLWIDDLQWADQDSLDLLARLLAPGGLSFFLLGTVRGTEEGARATLRGLLDSERATLLTPRPFGEEEIRALLPGAPAALREQLHREARGNAYLATELAEALSRRGQAADLRGLLQARREQLPEESQRALDALYAAGGPLSFGVLREVTGLPSPALARAVDELRHARWLRAVDGGHDGEEAYDAYHDRPREIIYEETEPSQRRALHQRLARALSLDGAEPEVVAEHLRRAGELAAAGEWLLRAARKATAQLAHERAAALCLRALEEGRLSPEDAAEAHEERAAALSRAGARYAEAAAAYHHASRASAGPRAIERLLRAAEMELRDARLEDALDSCARAAAPLGARPIPNGLPGTLAEVVKNLTEAELRLAGPLRLEDRLPSETERLLHILYNQIAISLAAFDLFRASLFGTRALLLALRGRCGALVIDTTLQYAYYLSLRRTRYQLARAWALTEQSLRWHQQRGAPGSFMTDLGAPVIAACAGRFTESLQLGSEALASYRQRGLQRTLEYSFGLVYLGLAELGAGAPGESIHNLRTTWERAVSSQDAVVSRLVTPNLARIEHALGRDEAAARVLGSMPAPRAGYYSALEGLAANERAAQLLSAGEIGASRAVLSHALAEPLRCGGIAYPEQRLRAFLLLALGHLWEATHRGDRAGLARGLSLARRVSRSDDPVLEGAGLRLEGLLLRAAGDEGQARQKFDQAVLSLSLRGEAPELAAALLARYSLSRDPADRKRGEAILAAGIADPAAREGGAWSWR